MNTPTEITIPRLFDAHCHFRSDDRMQYVVPETARYARYATAMPNTRPRAILEASDVDWYRWQLYHVRDSMPDPQPFDPIMTTEFRDSTTPSIVEAAFRAGAKAAKVYPPDLTTNSEHGLRDFFSPKTLASFDVMQGLGMLLLIHGERNAPRSLLTDWERLFLPTLQRLRDTFPCLKIVLEHVSTKEAVDFVLRGDKYLNATITAHHLCLMLNDVLVGGTHPHHHCMPVPKSFEDRDALLAAAMSGNPRIFLGSDTAPHFREQKEGATGACGVYTAPILPQLLAEIFEAHGRLDRLADFTSSFGCAVYELPPVEETITLVKTPWMVREHIHGIVPFRAGAKLQWQFAT
jgi:dihydroorotase